MGNQDLENTLSYIKPKGKKALPLFSLLPSALSFKTLKWLGRGLIG